MTTQQAFQQGVIDYVIFPFVGSSEGKEIIMETSQVSPVKPYRPGGFIDAGIIKTTPNEVVRVHKPDRFVFNGIVTQRTTHGAYVASSPMGEFGEWFASQFIRTIRAAR